MIHTNSNNVLHSLAKYYIKLPLDRESYISDLKLYIITNIRGINEHMG